MQLDELESLRAKFPVTKRWAFLDHAAVSAPPSDCADTIVEWAKESSENGIAAFLKWHERVKIARRHAGRLINADPHDICFIGNTTHGINLIAEGFPWRAGDNIVTSADEYPSNQYPWMNQRHRGVEYRAIPSDGPRVRPSDLMAACDEHTRVLAISSVEFATGFRNDLMTLGEFCRKRGIFFFVDAIQSLGIIPLDVQSLPIDALAADSHKWLLGPEGAGIAYIRREWIDTLHPIGVGWNSVVNAIEFSKIDWNPHPHAGRFEGGTLNVGGVVGMGESMRMLMEIGIDRVQERIFQLLDHLAEAVRRKGCIVYSSFEANERSGILSIETPGIDPKDLMHRCRTAGVIVNVRGGRIRISPHVYNTIEEINRFVDVLPQSLS